MGSLDLYHPEQPLEGKGVEFALVCLVPVACPPYNVSKGECP